MKKSTNCAALKKVRKNVRKHFGGNEALELYSILSGKLFRSVIEILDFVSVPQPELVEEDSELLSVVANILNALRNGPLTIDPMDVEANELIQILSSPIWCSFIEAYSEIATKHFQMPELPDITFAISGVGAYGTLGSIKTSREQIRLLNVRSVNGSSGDFVQNGMVNDPYASRVGILSSDNTVGYIDLNNNQATLTGGGIGTALPPVEGTLKMVGIQKNSGEDLGITVTQQQYMSTFYGLVKELVIKRILATSRVEQLGLLHEGDVIREVNGIPVDNPEVLQKILSNASGTVTLKIIPASQSNAVFSQLFLKAHFSYNPKNDNLIPCKEAGLRFSAGSILQVLKQEDPYWWQARLHNEDTRAGLIPSMVLQERRKAFTQSAPNPEELTYKMFACGLARRRKKKVLIPFCAKDADEYESTDLVLYEEVAMVSGFQRPVICFIGAPGVGRRCLINSLIRSNSGRYAAPTPVTSKPPEPDEEDVNEFILESREQMELENFNNKYIEFGEYDGNFYGTKYDSIRDIVKSGRTCLLQCSVHAIKRLRNSEFMPYVVMLAAPSVSCMKAMYEYGMSMGFTDKWKRDESFRRTLEESIYIEQNYRHLIDLILLCDNFEATFEQLNQRLNNLLTEPQWVPAKWLY